MRSGEKILLLMVLLTLFIFACKDTVIEEPKTGESKTDEPKGDKPVGEIKEGSGVFTFNSFAPQSDKPIRVFYHNPGGENLPVLILLHGTNRNAQTYRNNMASHAQRLKFLLIAPEFSTEMFPSNRNYHQGNVLANGGVPINEDLWSFSLIEPLFDFVKADVGSERNSYFLYGFSAGGQFTHRFNWHTADKNRAEAIVFGASGYYTMPDWDINYPYGLKQTVVTEAMVRTALGQRRYVLIGENDNVQDGNVTDNTQANAQGAYRRDRARNFFAKAQALAAEEGWSFNWEYIEVPGVVHSNSRVAKTVADLLFGEQ